MIQPEASAGPSLPWARRFAILCLYQVVGWTLIPLLLHPNVSLDVAEIVSWGRHWQAGYYKHPPLIAWIAEAARQIEFAFGGGKPWALYLCGQLAIVATYWAVWRFAARLLSPREGFLAALALAGNWVFTTISLEFNHNTILLPFFALTGWFAFEALRASTPAWRWWLMLGAAIGLGMLAKYEMFFLAVCIAGFMLVDGRSRQWLAKPQPYVALALSLLVFAPNFKWLIDHQFVSLTYAQSRMGGAPGIRGHLINPLIFLCDQILYAGPIYIFILAWIGIPKLRPAATPDEKWNRRFILLLGFGPFILFILMSLVTGNLLRGTWGIPLIPFVPIFLLLLFVPRSQPNALRQTIALGIAFIGIQIAIAVLNPILTPRPLRIQFPGEELAARANLWRAQYPNLPLPAVAGERWLANNIAFYSPDRPAVLCDQGNYLDTARLDEANCPWTSIAAINQSGGILVWNVTREGPDIPPSLRAAFPAAQSPEIFELRWQTWRDAPPVKVGLAIVPPESRR
jgi:4-amino-4-deoxy-L-arabinose transferase-like glycosyltransferase